MVAVCVVVNTLFPVVSAIETMDAEGYRVTLTHEDGRIDHLIPDPELTTWLRAAHGADIHELAGKPWRAILANLSIR